MSHDPKEPYVRDPRTGRFVEHPLLERIHSSVAAPHKAYMPHWVTGLALAFLGELLFPLTNGWAWLILVVYLGTVEGVALKRAGFRDTLTEFLNWFLSGGSDRKALVVGFALYASSRLLSISAMAFPPWVDQEVPALLRWTPPSFLFGGFCIWLVPHLLKGGRDG